MENKVIIQRHPAEYKLIRKQGKHLMRLNPENKTPGGWEDTNILFGEPVYDFIGRLQSNFMSLRRWSRDE